MELTSFDFQHKVFSLDQAHFYKSRVDGKVYLKCLLGDHEVSIGLDTLSREFGITPDSQDANLFPVVTKALDYVKAVVPGDKIPSEVIDGSASWSIDEKHLKRAKDRLMAQVACWVTGEQRDFGDPTEISRMLEDPKVQQQLQDGFSRAAEALGLGKGNREKVVGMIEQLARELGYIEALRDYYRQVFKIETDLKLVQATLRGDKQSLENLMRIQQLIGRPIKSYRDSFANVDAQTSEVIAALKNITAIVSFVRKQRDDLHGGTLLWADQVEEWKTYDLNRRADCNRALQNLYRFAAQNFLEFESWF